MPSDETHQLTKGLPSATSTPTRKLITQNVIQIGMNVRIPATTLRRIFVSIDRVLPLCASPNNLCHDNALLRRTCSVRLRGRSCADGGGRLRERLAREDHHESALEEVARRRGLERAGVREVGLGGVGAKVRDYALNACIGGAHADTDTVVVPRRQEQTLRRRRPL